MLSGRRLDILSPSPLDIEIEDIAHGLARVARWNGQTTGKYGFSVAQHSVLVEQLVQLNAPSLTTGWRLAALLHDAPEFVIGDMITPFKSALGADYRRIEAGLAQAVHLRFRLPGILPERISHIIKRADRMAAFLEATQLAGFSEAEARRFSRARPRNGSSPPAPAMATHGSACWVAGRPQNRPGTQPLARGEFC